MLSDISDSGRKPGYIPDSILEILKDTSCSIQLMTAIVANRNNLPVNTVQEYIANPEQSRQDFLQNPDFSVKNVNELDEIMQDITSCITFRNAPVKPGAGAPGNTDDSGIPYSSDPSSDSEAGQKHVPDSILTILENTSCSIRLMNVVIINLDNLPVKTVREYMANPEQSLQDFLRLPGLGVQCVNELDEILRTYISAMIVNSLDGHSLPDIRQVHQKATGMVRKFCLRLRYPNNIINKKVSPELVSLLEDEQEHHTCSFFNFLKEYDRVISRLRLFEKSDWKTIDEFAMATSGILKKRMSAKGIIPEIEPILRFLMRGEIPTWPMIDTVVAPDKIPYGTLESAGHRDIDVKGIDPGNTDDWSISGLVAEALARLSQKQYDIIKQRYGIGMDRIKTLDKVAGFFDVTRENIRQIQNAALGKMATERMVKTLVAALKHEKIIDDFFSYRKIITRVWARKIYKSLNFEKRLAIDMAYGHFTSFLDDNSIFVETVWVQKQNLHLLDSMSERNTQSIKKRILESLCKQRLPLSLSSIRLEMPDISAQAINDVIIEDMNASIDGDIINAPDLPVSTYCFLILLEAGHEMRLIDIRKRIQQVFDKDLDVGKIRSAMKIDSRMILVGRGTYNIYENLDITPEDIAEIRERTYADLMVNGGFISVKVLFSRLFKKRTRGFRTLPNYYLLLGILHGDARFRTGKGLMAGLASVNSDMEYKTLGQDILLVLSDSAHPMTASEITKKLGNRRPVSYSTVFNTLKKLPGVIKTGQKYCREDGSNADFRNSIAD